MMFDALGVLALGQVPATTPIGPTNPAIISGYYVPGIRPGEADPVIWKPIPETVSFIDEKIEAMSVVLAGMPPGFRKVPTKGTGGFEKTEAGFSGFTKKGKVRP
jgi:hypothetical protein